MRSNANSAPSEQLVSEVRKIFAEKTDYPSYFLDSDSVLAEDLGIDPTTIEEVLADLSRRFELPATPGLRPEPEATISKIAESLGRLLGGNLEGATASGNGGNGGSGGNGSNGSGSAGAAQTEPAGAPIQASLAHPGGNGGGTDPSAGSNGGNGPRPEMTATEAQVSHPPAASVTSSGLANEIREVFAEVTRYPLEILSFEADLEEELGIDSVKLGEVFSVLRERFDLPEERIGIPEEQLRTIGGISQAIAEFLEHGTVEGQTGAQAPPAVPSAPPEAGTTDAARLVVPAAPSPVAADPVPADMEEQVRKVFAEVTRYPLEILTADAALEEDLGVDSVKLGEVFSVLRERFDLPEEQIGIPEEQLRTIGGISLALADFLRQRAGESGTVAAEAAAPAPQPEAVPAPSPAEAASSSAAIGVPVTASHATLTPENKPFEGKVAFVSGSGRGLGKEIAGYLADLGAHVVINSFHSREAGIETADEIRSRGGRVDHIWGSVANQDQLMAIFDQIESDIGHLDFFVSNASNGMLAPLSEITVEHWEKAFRTNVVGLHQSAMRAADLMRSRGGGKIITMSSPAAHGYVDYFGCMGAVKAAVESLTRSLAIELAPDNIQVNCVSPGPVYGDLLDKWPESKKLVARWEGNTAYERLCEARDVSHFVAYLLSEPVKLFTGSVLVMDGGISSQGW